ncbi:uncharacterized protein [Cherax quadricarinatus]|uniref:uncharacterized protein isoform X1 n=1 Tax=Cherax quadricarinatus TaxID=27406 RepID=UPI00387E3C8A
MNENHKVCKVLQVLLLIVVAGIPVPCTVVVLAVLGYSIPWQLMLVVCVVQLVLTTILLLLLRKSPASHSPQHDVGLQSEDAESGGDAGETSVTTDAPPKYDTVVGKPPPYSHLYTSAEACYLPVYHTPQHTDGDTTLTSEEEETTRDTDPPPYSEVSKTIAPV